MQSKEQILPISGNKFIPSDFPSLRLLIGPNTNGSTKNDIVLIFYKSNKSQRITDNRQQTFCIFAQTFDYDLRTNSCRHKKEGLLSDLLFDG